MDNLREQAEKRILTTRTDVADMTTEEIQKLVHELQVHQVELEMQNEELRNTQSELAEARDQYHELYEFAPVGYLTVDHALTVKEVNLTFTMMLGVDRGNLLGQRLSRFIILVDQHRNDGFLDMAKTPQKGDSVEVQFRRADGSHFWGLLKYMPASYEESETDSSRCTVTDITAHKEAEALRQEQQYAERLDLALDAGEMGMWDFDLVNNEMVWDERLYRLFGYGENVDITPSTFFEHIHEEDRARVEKAFEEIRESGTRFSDEFRLVREDGKIRWFVTRGKVIRDEKGRSVRITGVNYDVTARKQTDEKLRESEARLRALIDNLPFGFWSMDAKGRYVVQNEISRQAWGARVGKTPDEVDAPPEIRQLWKTNNNRAFAGEIVDEEVTSETIEDNESHFYRNIVAPVWVGEKIQGILGVNIDITERRRAQEKLAREHEIFQGVFDNIPVMLVLWHPRQEQFTLNEYAKKILGWTNEDANDGNFMAKLYPDPAYRVEVSTYMTSSLPDWREIKVTAKDGSEILSSWTNTSLTDGTMIGIGVDVRERKRVEEELRRARDEQEERVKEGTAQLRALAAELAKAEDQERERVAHILHDELQQQLAALKLKINQLLPRVERDGEPENRVQQTLALVDEAIRQTRTLSHELSPANLRMHGVFKALENLAEDMRGDHGLEVRLDLAADAEPQEEGAGATLFRAVKELLFNVIKHSGENVAWVEAKRVDDEIYISVSDEGVGVDREEIKNKRDSCTGLGLFGIEQRMVYLGGRMEMEGRPGEGHRVTLVMPCVGTTRTEAGKEVQESGSVDSAVPQQGAASLKEGIATPIRIVLADDHQVMRESLATRLEKEADLVIISQTATGKETVQRVMAEKPDVVIMDVRMEEVNGIEATKEITEKLPQIHVLGLSMHSDPETSRKMREAGAETLLTKSGSAEALCHTIRECVRAEKEQ